MSPLSTAHRARLAAVFGDDQRLARLPGDPAALQLHLRAGGEVAVVAGYPAERFEELDRCVVELLGGGEAAASWHRWVEAAGPALDAGLQLERDGRIQVYLRGHFAPEAALAAFSTAACEASGEVLANAAALFGRSSIDMIGVEPGEAPGAAVYLSVLHATRDDTAAIAESFDFLLAALKPEARERWRAARDRLLDTDAPERIYISLEPVESPRWLKIDVGRRSLEAVAAIAAALEIDVEPLVATARGAGLETASQVGLRLGSGPRLSTYHSIAIDDGRD